MVSHPIIAVRVKPNSPWIVLATVMVGTLLIGLDRTVVNLGLPGMISDFNISVSSAGWIATAYIISNAVFVPVFGRLGDMLGNRKIYLWNFVGFTIISVLAGLAWNLPSMIFFRALQGLVGAAVYPTAMSLIAKTFTDPSARAQALGIWSASFAVSSILGPLVGGPLIDNFSWRWLFYINLPIGLIGILMTLRYLPHDKPENKNSGFDYQGAMTLAVALSSLVLVLEKGREWGWLSAESIFAYGTVVVFSFLFYFIEKRQKDPLVDLRLFNNPIYSKILILSFISFGAMMGAMFLLPVFAQSYLGYNATQTGMIFIPMALALFVAAPIGGRLSRKIPLRYLTAVGMTISAFGIFLFSYIDVKTTVFDLTLPLIIFATGLGLSMAPMTAAATNSVPAHEVGVASAVLNLVRNIAGAVAIAVFGTILNNLIESNALHIGQDSVINNPSVTGIATALIIFKAQVDAFGEVFLIAASIMAFGVIVALFLRDPKIQKSQIEEASSVTSMSAH